MDEVDLEDELESRGVDILLVDEQPEGLLALEAILGGLGENLVRANSGAEALVKIMETDFAVILLDVEMTQMDAYDTAFVIHERAASRHTPIIFLATTQQTSRQVVRGYSAGAVDCIFKPLDPDILRSKVSVFVELARKTKLLHRQTLRLQASEQEARSLADALAQLLRDLKEKNHDLELARDRVERESQFKSKFLAVASHELRTPLNAIIGFSELLEQESFGPLLAKQKEYVGHVVGSGRDLLRLVNDILDLSKVEAGHLELNREMTPMALAVDSARHVVESFAKKQGVQLDIEVPSDLPDVYVDPLRMKQILYNLLSNGIKFTRADGQVRLRVRAQDGFMEVSVADTGIGIRTEDLPRLFREFEQIEPESGLRPEGTGLGLALTKRLVELHGGSVTVASEPQRGSTFTVRLPCREPLGDGSTAMGPIDTGDTG